MKSTLVWANQEPSRPDCLKRWAVWPRLSCNMPPSLAKTNAPRPRRQSCTSWSISNQAILHFSNSRILIRPLSCNRPATVWPKPSKTTATIIRAAVTIKTASSSPNKRRSITAPCLSPLHSRQTTPGPPVPAYRLCRSPWCPRQPLAHAYNQPVENAAAKPGLKSTAATYANLAV